MEPLKSTRAYGEVGETSLAMPSDGDAHSGQRRVLEQVTTLRRSKSKYSTKGSMGTSSPTSPQNDVFSDFKFSPPMVNGSSFTYDSSMLNGATKTQKYTVKQRSASTRSAAYQRDQRNALFPNSPTGQSLPAQTDFFNSFANANPQRIQTTNYQQTTKNYKQKSPDKLYTQNPLHGSGHAISFNNIQRNNSTNQVSESQFNNIRSFSTNSNPEHMFSIKNKVKSKSEINGFRINGESVSSDARLSEAVGLLCVNDENLQLRGASIIQHSTFTSEEARDEVRKLNGILPLVYLLNNSNPTVQQTAASALRNIVYKNTQNKEEVWRLEGVKEASNLLSQNKSPHIQKHVTGLLWNLSSAETIQMDLLRHALPVLTEKILKQYADQSSISADHDLCSESFCNATGCIRNLSSGKLQNRRIIRKTDGLIDSIVKHIESSKELGHDNEKSIENCLGVMHNLTYQLEKEEPAMFKEIYKQDPGYQSPSSSSDPGHIGCFSNQSHQIQQEIMPDFKTIMKMQPEGMNLLINKKTLQSYIDFLSSSDNLTTQEICIGTLHNLTAKKSLVSDMLSLQFIKMNGASTLIPLLDSPNDKLKYSVYTLLGNLSRSSHSQKLLAQQALPKVLNSFTSNISKERQWSDEADGAFAVGCNTVNKLLRAQPERGVTLVNRQTIDNLVQLTENLNSPKTTTAAGVLLQSLWSEKAFQNLFKKLGIKKEIFVNETTTAALRSVQVIE